jgi:hypothetical protein
MAEPIPSEGGLDLLDDLIEQYYLELVTNVKEIAKMGDFLKMLELRRKLSPENQEKKQLWDLLRKIRREAMKDHPLEQSKPDDEPKAICDTTTGEEVGK